MNFLKLLFRLYATTYDSLLRFDLMMIYGKVTDIVTNEDDELCSIRYADRPHKLWVAHHEPVTGLT